MKVKFIIILLCILTSIVLGVVWFVNRQITDFQAIEKEYTDKQPVLGQNTWQFSVIGDTEGVRDINGTMVDDMKNRPLAFVAHVGDISPTGEQTDMLSVKDLFSTLPFPTYYVPGNNDLVYDETIERKTSIEYQKNIKNELYYSMNVHNAHMIFLDNSYRRVGFSDEELDWLKNDLQQNTQPLTFLFFHRPLTVPGESFFGDDETTYSRGQNQKFRDLIAQFTIDHIFTGHLHTSLTYSLDKTQLTITGGGGALPQDFLGGEEAAYFHYVLVTVEEGENPQYTFENIPFNKQ